MFPTRLSLILALVPLVLSVLTQTVRAQDGQPPTPAYDDLMEDYYLFRQRFLGSDCTNVGKDPTKYACCHPLPHWGTPDSSCTWVPQDGDPCDEDDSDCFCQDDDGGGEGDDEGDDGAQGGNGTDSALGAMGTSPAQSSGVGAPAQTSGGTGDGGDDADDADDVDDADDADDVDDAENTNTTS